MKLGGAFIAAAALVLSSSAYAAGEQPICADRPGKATPTCTVPKGMVQVETGLVDWTSDELDIGQTAVKVGVTDRLALRCPDFPRRQRLRDCSIRHVKVAEREATVIVGHGSVRDAEDTGYDHVRRRLYRRPRGRDPRGAPA